MRSAFLLAACGLIAPALYAATVIRPEPLHLRLGDQREWSSFPSSAQPASIEFSSRANPREYALVLRQRDVKALWTVTLNEVNVGALIEDERDMLRILAIPPSVLRDGSNRLAFVGKPGRFNDDIEIRDLRIEEVSPAELQRQSTIDVSVTAAGGVMPVRITVVDGKGSLVPLSALRTGVHEAIRTGVVYTADGRTSIGVPAGEYRVYASRGFEYSAPSARARLSAGERVSLALKIRREVDMSGYASCDTHVHTFELSRHGDASVDERVLTAAGEGLDLMVATEHNRFDDYAAAVRTRGLDRWVMSIPGSEVTTPIGHFNIFPVRPGASQPDPSERDWLKLMDAIRSTSGVGVVIQNHPRDLHSNYRPFEPSHHISSLGENLQARPVMANAMEVVNSGAMSSDPLQLVRDWLGLLTRGAQVAAIGASDTHTVDFVPIGQARTYVEVPDGWRKNAERVAAQIAAGRTIVSYGLAADIRQSDAVRSGTVRVELTVWGPSWSAADQVVIYSNGTPVWRQKLNLSRKPGRKFAARIVVPLPRHDAALVAVATGPGVIEPFWEVRKPYQPTSEDWSPMVLGVSRALWIDSDGSGKREAPLAHAQQLVERHGSDHAAIVKALTGYDASVAKHVFHLLRAAGRKIEDEIPAASAAVKDAYRQYTEELRPTKR